MCTHFIIDEFSLFINKVNIKSLLWSDNKTSDNDGATYDRLIDVRRMLDRRNESQGELSAPTSEERAFSGTSPLSITGRRLLSDPLSCGIILVRSYPSPRKIMIESSLLDIKFLKLAALSKDEDSSSGIRLKELAYQTFDHSVRFKARHHQALRGWISKKYLK